jgi:hypothetical protein
MRRMERDPEGLHMENGKTPGKEKKHRPGWIRALDITMRAAHIATTGVLFGGAVFSVPFSRLISWHQGAVASGVVLALLGINQSRRWFCEIRGVMVMAHVAILGLVRLCPEHRPSIVAIALVIGAVVSHMPGDIRHWSLLHGCKSD